MAQAGEAHISHVVIPPRSDVQADRVEIDPEHVTQALTMAEISSAGWISL